MESSPGDMPTEFVSLKDLAKVLNRSETLVRLVAKSLDVDMSCKGVALGDALELMRYFASCKDGQDKLLNSQYSKLKAAKAREFEHAIALEIVKRERSWLEDQVQQLYDQLQHEQQRSERLEHKLHDLTASFAHLVSQRDRLVAHTKFHSKATVRQHKGREVLYLEKPVNSHLLNWVGS